MEVMERRGVAGSDDVAWKMGRILLRYRPIAPKPSATGAPPSTAGAVLPATNVREKRRGGKRRQGGFTGGRRGRKSKKVEQEVVRSVVTLPLMPEMPDNKDGVVAVSSPMWSCAATSPYLWRAFEGPPAPVAGVVVAPTPVRVVAASVTVESVTDTWDMEIGGGIVNDEEIWRWLDSDESPAFVSDAGDRVTWCNAAFRRMVIGGGSLPDSLSSSSSSSSLSSSTSYSSSSSSAAVSLPEAREVRVALATRGLLTGRTCRVFTCMARMRYACRMRGKISLVSPCDAWRMADGSLAWRLDVKTALSLSITA